MKKVLKIICIIIAIALLMLIAYWVYMRSQVSLL